MFSKNLKYYRLKKGMTKKELAEQIQASSMSITNYENGNRKPDMEVLKKMAEVLNVRIADFLTVRNDNIAFSHGEFRKSSSLIKAQQEYVRESVEEYFQRFMTIVEILGGEVLPEPPQPEALVLFGDAEKDGLALRQHLNLSEEGPIDDLIEILENKGILVYALDINNDNFFGMNGFVNERPYIVINQHMSPERSRSTIVHELAHMMFQWPSSIDHKEEEHHSTAISGAFLFPKNDVIRELGIRRRLISKDMTLIAKEYGISMYTLVKRARLCNVISESVEKDFYFKATKAGWKKNEPIRIDREMPTLFQQLVYRGVNEQEISMQRGAELLKIPYDDIADRCCFSEDE